MKQIMCLTLTMTFFASCRSNSYREQPDRPTEIQGISCWGAEFYETGELEFCLLARDDSLSGQLLQAGTGVAFTREGHMDWCFLRHDTQIQGHLCRGHRNDWMTGFHPNGKLRLAWLAQMECIQGVPCMAASFWRDLFRGGPAGTYFHDNGKLKICRLAKGVTIEGHSFKKCDYVRFDREGRLRLVLEK